jgi:pyruvate/2-oxoglutarate dehydrogenase complex dihydrolipoamide dehydrogenase (E3) component
MVAALSAAQENHEVVLIEESSELGGLLKWASKGPFKEDLADYLNYLKTQVNKAAIEVRLNTKATKEIIEELSPDRLILCMGSHARELKTEGFEKCMDSLAAIEDHTKIGQKVVIIGGGSNGCELALELALEGHDVKVVEMAEEIAGNGNILYRIGLNQHLKHQDHLEIYTKSVCKKIDEKGVEIEKDGKTQYLEADTVINATGRISNKDEAFGLYGICADTVMCGDCEKVGAVIDAVNLAYFVGKSC